MSESMPAAGAAVSGVVAVLSHHASLAMQMRRAGFDVVEGRDIDDLAKVAASVDVVVVDLVRVESKRSLVARLSTAVDPRVPVVLISADEVDLALLGTSRDVHVVVPPVRADDVISRVRTILAARSPASPEAAGGRSGRSGGSVTTLRDLNMLRRSRRKPLPRVEDVRPTPTTVPAANGRPTVAVGAGTRATTSPPASAATEMPAHVPAQAPAQAPVQAAVQAAAQVPAAPAKVAEPAPSKVAAGEPDQPKSAPAPTAPAQAAPPTPAPVVSASPGPAPAVPAPAVVPPSVPEPVAAAPVVPEPVTAVPVVPEPVTAAPAPTPAPARPPAPAPAKPAPKAATSKRAAAPASSALVKLSDRKARKAAKKVAVQAPPKAARSAPTTAAAAAAAHARAAVAGTGPSSPSLPADLGVLPAPTLDWRVIANQLTHAVQGIPAISLVAQTMADELAANSGAHVAVMVRDDRGSWRVEGGAGLRAFEWAQTIEDDHWLVMAGRDQHPSLMVMDTDVVRSDLIGAPLASRLQLVRTHSTRASFFVCAGWDDNGNDTGRVALVVETVRRHSPAMADAMGLRSFTLWLSGQVDGLQGMPGLGGPSPA